MNKFYVTKMVAADELDSFVARLNQKTRTAHISDQVRISSRLWLIRVCSTYRDDADFVRGL